MPETTENIIEFMYVQEVESDKLLDRLRKLTKTKSRSATAFYRGLLDLILDELDAGTLDPADIKQFVKQQLTRSIADDSLERAIFLGLEDDLNDIVRVMEKGFQFLDPEFRLNDLRIIARGRMGKYALDNGVKIADRMAVDIQNIARFYTGQELRDTAELYLGNATTRLDTVINDVLMGYDREMTFLSAEKYGLTHYKYRDVINTNTRFFCRQIVSLPYCYTLEQIEKMKNGHKLDVRTNAGGYRCIHGWSAGKVGWPGFEKPFPEKGRFVSKIGPDESKAVVVPLA